MHWKFTAALVCIYGVVKEFRPGTPFLTPFLKSSFKNFTNEEIYSEIYPFWTYSYLIFLVSNFCMLNFKIMGNCCTKVCGWGLGAEGTGAGL